MSRNEMPGATYMAADHTQLRSYDDQINIYDSPDELKHKLERLNAEGSLPGYGRRGTADTQFARKGDCYMCCERND